MTVYLNNPEAVLGVHVPVSHQDPEFQHAAHAVVSQIVIGWSGMLRSDINVVEIRGGLTNVLYAIENVPKGEKVLMRIFGLGTDLFIDRSIENLVFAHLSKQGMAPVFHGLFENGRLEGFLHARNLLPEEMCDRKIALHAAHVMAQLHQQSVPLPDPCSMWGKNAHMMLLVEDIHFQSPAKRDLLASLQLPEVGALAQRLRAYLDGKAERFAAAPAGSLSRLEEGQQFALDVAFTHNDLLSGNVMIPLDFQEREDVAFGEMKFIDYEYAGFNARSFDVANHFNEYMGFDFVREQFPEQNVRLRFIRDYVNSFNDSTGRYSSDVIASEDFLLGFDNITLAHTLLSHMYWGLWAVFQSSASSIDFDFLGYAKKRLDALRDHFEAYTAH